MSSDFSGDSRFLPSRRRKSAADIADIEIVNAGGTVNLIDSYVRANDSLLSVSGTGNVVVTRRDHRAGAGSHAERN